MEDEQCDFLASVDFGKKSQSTNLGKPNGIPFMEDKQCDSIASVYCGKKSHATCPGKPDGVYFMDKESTIMNGMC